MTGFLLPLPLILLGWALAGGSPGPATLAISGSAMEHGRRSALALACGVVTGSMCWGIAAGLGFSALMMSNLWLFETIRYAGAAYLLYLAFKSLRAAWRGTPAGQARPAQSAFFRKGLMLHLTNPKAILSWGSIYAIALPAEAGWTMVWTLFAALSLTSVTVFLGYAVIFSAAPISRAYLRSKRAFDAAFGLVFGAAGVKLLSMR